MSKQNAETSNYTINVRVGPMTTATGSMRDVMEQEAMNQALVVAAEYRDKGRTARVYVYRAGDSVPVAMYRSMDEVAA